mgnify:FL=1
MRPVPLTPSPPDDADGKLRWAIDRVSQLCTASQVDSPVDVAADNAGAYQPLDDDLTAIAAVATTTFGRAFLAMASEAVFKVAVNLEANTDFYAPGGTDVALADGGTGASLSDPGADRVMGWDESANATIWFAPTLGLETDTTNIRMTANQRTSAVIWEIDGGGAAITTGVKGEIRVPFACTITEYTLLADQSGSIVVDLWVDTYANYPPTVADTITASAKPTISATTKATSSTLTGWTTSIAAGSTMKFNVDSITTLTRCTVILTVLKT